MRLAWGLVGASPSSSRRDVLVEVILPQYSIMYGQAVRIPPDVAPRAALLQLRKMGRNVRLGIIGPIGENTQLHDPELREAIVSFGRVPFHKLPLYLGACDAYVLPMRNNVVNRTRWPNKFGDYIAAGRPVLCSPVGDVARFVESNQCGILWRDSSELASGIEYLMDNPVEASVMGGHARMLAEGELSWATLARRFADLYHSTLRGET